MIAARFYAWLLWIAFSAVGTALGGLIGIIVFLLPLSNLYYVLPADFQQQFPFSVDNLSYAVGLVLNGAAAGAALGAAQALRLDQWGLGNDAAPPVYIKNLRTWLRYAPPSPFWPWTLATGAAGLVVALGILGQLSLVLGLLAEEPASSHLPTVVILAGTLSGAGISGLAGALQWLILRRWISSASWWVPLHVLSGLVAFALTFATAPAYDMDQEYGALPLTGASVFGLLLALGFSWVLGGLLLARTRPISRSTPIPDFLQPPP